MTELPDLASVDDATAIRLTYLVVIDHPDGTDVYGAGDDGAPVTRRLAASGNLPWGAILGLAAEHSQWRAGEPGVEDVEPETGFRRFTFPAIPR